MRKGISFPMDLTMDRQREVAKEVEAAGMDSLWTSDQFGRDPMMICMAWAQATTTLQVGVGVLQMLTRSVPQMAKSAATVQEESGGRFHLGFGVSTAGANRMHGIEQPPVLSAARDAIAIFDSIFAGQATEYDGKVLSSHGFQLTMTPAPPRPPVYLGAMGPKMLALAGSHYDGTVLSWESPAGIAKQAKIVRDAAAQAGRPDPHLGAYVRMCVANDREEAKRALANAIGFYFPYYGEHFKALNMGPSYDIAYAAYQEGKGIEAASALLEDDVLLSLGWYGTPQDDIEPFVDEYVQSGVNHLIGRVVPVGDAVESLRLVLAKL